MRIPKPDPDPNSVDPTDEELMEQFQDGSPEAFRSLLGRYETRVYGFFLRSFSDPELARDLTQDSFLRIVRGRHGYRRGARYRSWMWQIVRNHRVDTLRRLSHRRHASLDAPVAGTEGSARVELLADVNAGNSERDSHDRQFMKALEAALPELEADQREVFLLRQIEGLSYKEIAEVQDVNVNTVKSRMRYALTHLRTLLAPLAPEKDQP